MADSKVVEKILAMLAKAESTTHEEEADAFIAGAQRLMMKYAIDEAALEAAGGKQVAEDIVTHTVEIMKWIRDEQGSFLGSLARLLNCRVYWSNYAESRKGAVTYHIVGFERDVVFVEILFASLRAQANAAAIHAGAAGTEKVECDNCRGTGTDSYRDETWQCEACKGKGHKLRHRESGGRGQSFYKGYFQRVVARCTDRYQKAVEDAGESVALVLVDRGKRVDDWLRDNVQLGSARATRRRNFDPAAFNAGRDAGANADISGGRNNLGGNGRKALS